MAQVLREALARGADRALHVDADALASALRAEPVDLILTGLQSADQGFAQTGVILAERLGLTHATIAMDVQVVAAHPGRYG